MAAKYLNIASDLRQECRLLRRNGAEKLPSESELCTRYACSRQTVRSALALLTEEGLIERRQGSGSYLSSRQLPHSSQVVLMIPDENEYLYPSLVSDLRLRLSSAGYALSCRNTYARHSREREELQSVLDSPPAAVLLEAICNCLPNPNEDLILQLEQSGIPLVYLFCSYSPSDRVPCVSEADRAGAYQLVHYLAAKGHRDIAGIFRSDDSRGHERYRGALQACRDLGIPSTEQRFLWFSAEMREQMLNGDASFLQSLLRGPLSSCSAAVCQNDELAYYLLRESERLVPRRSEAIELVSFDDSHYAYAGNKKILSLSHRPHALADTAAQTLLAVMRGSGDSPAPVPWRLPLQERIG